MIETDATKTRSILITLEITDSETVDCYADDEESVIQDLYQGTLLNKCDVKSIKTNVQQASFIGDDLTMLDQWKCDSCGEIVFDHCEIKPSFCTSCGVEFREWQNRTITNEFPNKKH